MSLNTVKILIRWNMDSKTVVKCAQSSFILTMTTEEDSARRLNLQHPMMRTFTLSIVREKPKFVDLTLIQMMQHKTVFCKHVHLLHTIKSLSNRLMVHMLVNCALKTTPSLMHRRRGYVKMSR